MVLSQTDLHRSNLGKPRRIHNLQLSDQLKKDKSTFIVVFLL